MCNFSLNALGNDVPHLEISIVSNYKRVGICRFRAFQLREFLGHAIEDRMVLQLNFNVHLPCCVQIVRDRFVYCFKASVVRIPVVSTVPPNNPAVRVIPLSFAGKMNASKPGV